MLKKLIDNKVMDKKKKTPPKGVAVVAPQVTKEKRISHFISGLSRLSEYATNGKYYATVCRSTGNSKESLYNTRRDVMTMIMREVGRGNPVVIRKGRKQLVLKQKEE